MKSKTLVGALTAAGIVLGAGVGAYSTDALHNARAQAPLSAMAAAAPAPAPVAQSTNVAALPDFSAIAERYGPAVVNISVTAKARPAAMTPFDDEDLGPFAPFFRRFAVPRQAVPVRGLGSGFIVDPEGVILTNAHVVDGASEVTVKLTDRREYKAKVLGTDKLTDIAVIKIDAHNLPVVRLGSPDSVKVGEWVVAIGSPYGFENSVTAGIVSAKSRSLPDDTYVPFIQTDVAVNPGNSGGPLFNLRGEVVGINSQIYSQTGGFQGLSFAIPIDVAQKVKDQLQKTGKVTRGRLGVAIQEVNQQLARSFGLERPMGALVSSVEPDSPAAKAGLKSGDIILKFNGKDINRSADLPALVADVKPGTRSTMQVWRERGAKELSVTVGEMKPDRTLAHNDGADHGRLGLAVRPLAPEEKRASGESGGLVVEGASGPAAEAGIQPGDIVLAVNGVPVQSVEQLRGLIGKGGKNVALLIARDTGNGTAHIFVPIDLG